MLYRNAENDDYRAILKFERKVFKKDFSAFLPKKSAMQLKNYRYKRWDENGFHIEQITLKTPKKDLVQVCKHNDTVMTTWKVEHFCKDSEDIDAYMSMPFVPAKYDFSDYKRIKKELGDNGIVMSTIPDPICEAMELIEFGEGTV